MICYLNESSSSRGNTFAECLFRDLAQTGLVFEAKNDAVQSVDADSDFY